MEDQIRRVEQIHARLLGHLWRVGVDGAKGRAERTRGPLMAAPAVKIDDKHRRAEIRGLAQDAQPRAGAEIVGDQAAEALAVGWRRHQAAFSCGEAGGPSAARTWAN